MKTLLPAIKTALHAHTIVTTDSDIYITPDVRWRPEGTGTPSIGIHDAGMQREELAGEYWEMTATVELAAFVSLSSNGSDSICGTSGLYAILDAAVAILNDNMLSVSGLISIQVGNDSASSIVAEGDGLVTMTRTLIYTIERSGA